MNLTFSTFESTLCNSYFLTSLLVTIYYWTKVIFLSKKTNFGFVGLCFVNFLLILQLSSRWIVSGHFPLSSLYESLLFLAWGMNSIYITIEYLTKNEFIGVLVSPILLCILGFTGFSLPPELQEMKPLVPALQSNWLFMHVSVMMLSYAGLLVGSIFSIAYLVIYASLNNNTKHIFSDQNGSSATFTQDALFQDKIRPDSMSTSLISTNLPIIPASNFTATSNTYISDNLNSFFLNKIDKINGALSSTGRESDKLLTLFDNLSYRTIGIGFCFLTLGILSGAVWANETWGTYWSWDPKETWALITWLTFAVYLHTRFLRGWQGVKPAAIATLGFLLVWVCYLGVNILGKGLHTYGFLN